MNEKTGMTRLAQSFMCMLVLLQNRGDSRVANQQLALRTVGIIDYLRRWIEHHH